MHSLNLVACRPSRNIAIVGGGLAGLSVCYHLLNMTRGTTCSITVIDQAVRANPPKTALEKIGLDGNDASGTLQDTGHGGASGAMAGILHNVTPRGKKIWMV